MNYYDILGIQKTASADEIKQAYKKLARDHHPDRGGDSKKFAEINAAYDVLKDPAKRQEYDHSFQRRYTTSNTFTANEFDFDFFNDFFEKTFRNYSPPINKDISVVLSMELKDVFQPKNVQIKYKTSTGLEESVDVNIPAGIKTGDMIRYKGLGDDHDHRFPRGNLNVKIHVSEDTVWKRNNNDIWCKQTVDVFDLLLGCVIIITTPENKSVKLTIPKGSKTNSVFNISDYVYLIETQA